MRLTIPVKDNVAGEKKFQKENVVKTVKDHTVARETVSKLINASVENA